MRNRFTPRSLISAVIGACIALVTFYLIVIITDIILIVGFLALFFAITMLTISALAYLQIQQGIGGLFVYRLDGLRYLSWFLGNSLLWIAIGTLISGAFLKLFGASFWVLAICAGMFAISIYSLQGIFFLRRIMWYRLCWTLPDIQQYTAENPDYAILLKDRYRLALRNDKEISDYTGLIRQAIHTGNAKFVTFDKSASNHNHFIVYFPTELWIRMRALTPVFIATTVISLFIFLLGWSALLTTAEPVRHTLAPFMATQNVGTEDQTSVAVADTESITPTPDINQSDNSDAEQNTNQGDNGDSEQDSNQGDNGDAEQNTNQGNNGDAEQNANQGNNGDSQQDSDQGDNGNAEQDANQGNNGDSQQDGNQGDSQQDTNQGNNGDSQQDSDQGDRGDSQQDGNQSDSGDAEQNANQGNNGDSQQDSDQGDNGDSQQDGNQSDSGDAEQNGDQGDNGDAEQNGDQGNNSDSQQNGDQGNNGDAEQNGDQGDNGDAEQNGDQGNNSDSQQNGDQGNNGDAEQNGDQGDNGNSQQDGDQGDNGDAQQDGNQGNSEQDSDQGDNGNSQQDASQGNNGDSQQDSNQGDNGDSQQDGNQSDNGDPEQDSNQGDNGDAEQNTNQGDNGDSEQDGNQANSENSPQEGDSAESSGSGGNGDSGDGSSDSFGTGISTPVMLDEPFNDIPTPSAAGFNPADKITVAVPPMRVPSRDPSDANDPNPTEGEFNPAESSEAIDATQQSNPFSIDQSLTYQFIPNWILELTNKES